MKNKQHKQASNQQYKLEATCPLAAHQKPIKKNNETIQSMKGETKEW
jgi:hypothetical protein